MLEGSKLLFTHFFQLFSWKSFLHNAPSLWDKGHSLKEGQEVHMESTNFTQEQKSASITMRVSKAGRGMRDELRTGQRLLSTEARCWIPDNSSCSSQLWATFDNLHQFSSVTQSRPTLRPHESQHTRPPCPSPTPGVHPNPCPLTRWCHPTISSCHPLLLLPSIFPSIRVFSNELALRIRWPKDWSFSFNISPSKEHPGLISFRMDWLDLFAVQGILKSLLQHHSSKASILRRSAFFTVQL